MEENQHESNNPSTQDMFLAEKKQIKLIKIAIVVIAIGSAGYIAADPLWHPQTSTGLGLEGVSKEDSSQIKSGFGAITIFDDNQEQKTNTDASLTFVDEGLGFEISKPNSDWDFNDDLDAIQQDSNYQLLSTGFNGGLYIEKENDKAFFVGVFDINNPDQFLLKDYVTTQTDYLQSKYETKVLVKNVSPNNDWAIFGMLVNFGDRTSYGEQLLQIHNGRLYMLQYTGLPPEKLAQQDIEDRRQIIDSFYVKKI